MTPPIPGEWIIQGGAVSVLAFVVLLIVLGWLAPRSTIKQLERDRDFWREAALKSIRHTDVLLPAARITTEVTRALSDASRAENVAPGGEAE